MKLRNKAAATAAAAITLTTMAAPPASAGVRLSDTQLARLRACESGGNYRAVNRSGRYYGAYQFDIRTWRTVGGRVRPDKASPAEQDARTRVLAARRGLRPWPVCGKRV